MRTPARRRCVRFDARCPISIISRGRRIEAVTVNIAARSALITDPLLPLTSGEPVRIHVGTPPGGVTLDGTLVRRDHAGAVLAWPAPGLAALRDLRDVIDAHRGEER